MRRHPEPRPGRHGRLSPGFGLGWTAPRRGDEKLSCADPDPPVAVIPSRAIGIMSLQIVTKNKVLESPMDA
jgi:hypothetical protein